MKKYIIILFFAIILISCSFDNKSGIWKGNQEEVKKKSQKKNLKSITTSKFENIDQITISNKNFFKLSKIIKTVSWEDPQLNPKNFYSNLYFNGNFNFSNTKKLSSKKIEKEILYKNDKIIFRDVKGTIYVYTLSDSTLKKFNFYKKKYKSFKLKTFITLSDNSIYIADNMGYAYCLELESVSLKWAKFYKIPFMSNIKIIDKKIFLTNENNDIFVLNKANGEKQWNFTTDNSIFKSDYLNNLSIFDTNLLLLNTNGSAYSINYVNRQLNWILNFKDFLSTKTSNIFKGKHLIIQKKNVLISSNRLVALHNINTGMKYWELKIDNYLNPVFSEDLIFLVDKKLNLISIDTSSGHLVWKKSFSQIINDQVLSELKKNKVGKISDLKLINNKLFLFTSKAKLIQIDPMNGTVLNYINLPSEINSNVILVGGKMIYIDKKNRLVKTG